MQYNHDLWHAKQHVKLGKVGKVRLIPSRISLNIVGQQEGSKMHARQFVISLVFFLFAFLAGGVTHSQTPARDGYIGIVSKADGRKSGEQFTFANLRSQRPFITFPSGNGEETTKVFEDDETIVLIFVAHLTGSTETFYLNKKRNRFTLIEVGALEATATGADFRPKVTYGTLK
ncbi:MAG TPA: hypothetical protein DEA71_15015 [Nitrospira sp.]|nr:hypothetical protein [Nitrospira sp.]